MIGLRRGFYAPNVAALGVAPYDPVAALSPLAMLRVGSGLKQTVGGTAATADGDPVGQWLDSSGNGNHVTQTTAGQRPVLKLAVQNGKNAVRFTAASVNELLFASAIVTTYPFTICLWFRGLSASFSPLVIVTNTTTAATDGYRCDYRGDLSPKACYITTYTGGFHSDAVDTLTLSESQWYHGAFVFKNATDRRTYINAANVGQDTSNKTPTGINNVSIGGGPNGVGHWNADVDLDDILFANYELSTTDITNLYTGTPH